MAAFHASRFLRELSAHIHRPHPGRLWHELTHSAIAHEARDGSWWSDQDHDGTTGSEGGGQSVAQHGAIRPAEDIPRWVARLLDARTVGAAQGLFYLALALWPLTAPFSFNAFVWQNDTWLAQLGGGLLVVVAIALLSAAWGRGRGRASDASILGVGTAVLLTVLNLMLLSEPNTSRLHLVDVALETGWLTWWVAALLGMPRQVERRGRVQSAPAHGAISGVVNEPDYH